MDKVGLNSPSVQSYLTILQSVISRMAANSAACKTWCITLVSVVIVIIADKGKPNYIWISIVPVAPFLVLDSYYLSLECQFRSIYNDFIRKLHADTATVEDVFYVNPKSGICATSLPILKAMVSMSIWPFYGLLALMLLIVRFCVL
jgi:hypothetical protein